MWSIGFGVGSCRTCQAPTENKWDCSRCKQRHNLRARYKMELEVYEAEVSKRNGCCDICSKKRKLYVDHCHQTSKIRGLLCLQCNSGIGKLKDDPYRVAKALDYLLNYHGEDK